MTIREGIKRILLWLKKISNKIDDGGSGSGSGGSKENFVPINALLTYSVGITDAKHERDEYYSYRFMDKLLVNYMLVQNRVHINILVFNYPIIDTNVVTAIERFYDQNVLFYYNDDLCGGCFYSDGNDVRIVTNKFLNSNIIRVPISKQLYIKQ